MFDVKRQPSGKIVMTGEQRLDSPWGVVSNVWCGNNLCSMVKEKLACDYLYNAERSFIFQFFLNSECIKRILSFILALKRAESSRDECVCLDVLTCMCVCG